MKTAMILSGGGFQGLPVMRALKAMGWRVLIADSIADSINRFEAEVFVQVPPVREKLAFRAAIVHLVEQYAVQAVFPTTMYDLPALVELRPELEALGVRALASSPRLVELLSDKRETLLAAAKAGLPVLDLVDPTSHDFSYPLIGKPIRGWGGIGIARIANLAQWKSSTGHASSEPRIWQRLLGAFTEWSVDFALREDAQCSPLSVRRRLRTSGGFAVISEIVENPEVEFIAAKTVRWLVQEGGCGIFNAQFLQEPNGALWLSDLNPRPGTSSGAALAAGVNLAKFLLERAHSPQRVRAGIAVRTLSDRYFPKLTANIQGVVIDLDETIICQKSWMRDKLIIVADMLSGKVDANKVRCWRQTALRVIDEGPWDRLIDVSLARSGVTEIDRNELISMWRQANPVEITLHPDARALIYTLQERGIPFAMLSDNPAASQRQKIARLPSDMNFSAIVLTDEIVAPKPDKKGFIKASEELGIPVENMVMIGDNPWLDALGAVQAGYAHAFVVRRPGGMLNPANALFNSEYPQYADCIEWVDSLFGLDYLFDSQH